MEDSGHSSISGRTVHSASPVRLSAIDIDGDSSHSSSATSLSDFGNFGASFGSKYNGGDSSGGEYHNDYDVHYLRMKNMELKRELRKLQDDYDIQGRLLDVTVRKEELVYSFLPGPKYSFLWHFTPRGLEYTQLIWWIARDQAWILHDIPIATAFGILSLAWCCLSLVRVIYALSYTLTTPTEFFNALARLLWMIGMYIWMQASMHDPVAQYNNTYTPAASANRMVCSVILFVAMVMQCGHLYTRIRGWKIILLPDEAIPVKQAEEFRPFEEPRIRAKFYYLFGSYRDWEHAALFLLIGRDLAASLKWQAWWICWVILSYCCQVFLLTVTFNTRKAIVDHLHYVAYTLWLLGTFTFQMGHMFLHNQLNPWPYMYPRYSSPEYMANYFANVIVLLAYIPIALYMFSWVFATLFGFIKGDEKDMVPWDTVAADTQYNYEETHQRIEPDRIEENWIGETHAKGISPPSFITIPIPVSLVVPSLSSLFPSLSQLFLAANRGDFKPV